MFIVSAIHNVLLSPEERKTTEAAARSRYFAPLDLWRMSYATDL